MRRCLALALVTLAGITILAPRADAAIKPNDALFVHQWGLVQIRADQAWAVTRGAGAVIAVVDSGVDRTHPDLAANLLLGIEFDSTKSCAKGCGNGSPAKPAPGKQVEAHGTHVAGIAAAVANNGVGVAGVAPGARILPVRVETIDDIPTGIRWAADHGANVINLSLGVGIGAGPVLVPGSGMFTDELDASVQYAQRKGVVVVAAAGNETFPLCDNPSDIDGVLCVAATDRAGNPADYSNLPGKGDGLSVRAPGGAAATSFSCGEGIVSTTPVGTGLDQCGYPHDKRYGEMVGTSMAAPHVAGLAALLRSIGCDRKAILELITTTARNPLGAGYDDVYGWGIVDAAAAVKGAATRC